MKWPPTHVTTDWLRFCNPPALRFRRIETSLTNNHVFVRHVTKFAFYLKAHFYRHMFLTAFVATFGPDSLRTHILIFEA